MKSIKNSKIIMKLFKAEKFLVQITKAFEMLRSTVYKALKRYQDQELSTSKDRIRRGRPVTVTTQENCNKIRC